jgi:hypothetical protein
MKTQWVVDDMMMVSGGYPACIDAVPIFAASEEFQWNNAEERAGRSVKFSGDARASWPVPCHRLSRELGPVKTPTKLIWIYLS